MEYVEVRGRSVDVAVQAALEELGIERDRAEIEVLQEPEKGFLGMGGRDAVVKVSAKPEEKRKRRRRGGRSKQQSDSGGGQDSPKKQDGPQKSGGSRSNRSGGGKGSSGGGGGGGGGRGGQSKKRQTDTSRRQAEKEVTVTIEEQAPVVERFLEGLVQAFGLEGTVAVRIEDDVIIADVSGPQTEAMVGPRGSTIEAIHELTKTVLQRQTQSSARLRLDVAGYAERRREALSIYAGQLIDQVLEEGGEVMLEPMSAGDRKTIHDTVADREGVKSYSEGEAPQRYVVIAREGGDEEE